MKLKEVLTTGDVARLCHVAPRTVSKWFDTGKLAGYRIPGSRDRRIPTSQLLAFMRAHGMPVRQIEGGLTRVLVVQSDALAADAVAKPLKGRYEVRQAGNVFQAGMRAGEFTPHVILVDVLGEGIDAGEILRNVKANPALAATQVIALCGSLTTAQRDTLLRQGFFAVLARPLAPNDLIRAIEQATDLMG